MKPCRTILKDKLVSSTFYYDLYYRYRAEGIKEIPFLMYYAWFFNLNKHNFTKLNFVL